MKAQINRLSNHSEVVSGHAVRGVWSIAPQVTRTLLVCLLLGGAALASGCRSNSSDPGGVTDTNTNWLSSCTEDADCGELECRCGICTRACDAKADCADLSASAVCEVDEASSCDLGLSCLAEPSVSRDSGKQPGPVDDGSTDDDDNSSGDDANLDANDDSTNAGADDVDASTTDDSAGNDDGTTDSDSDDGVGIDDAAPPNDDLDDSTLDDGALDDGSPDDSMDSGITDDANPDDANSDDASSDDANSDDSGDGGVDACANAEVNGECFEEGAVCGDPCTDSCSFCNQLSCGAGIWRTIEIFPAPCFSCGDSLQCDPTQSYCFRDGNSYSCEPLPEECASDPSCECVGPAIGDAVCSGDAETGLTFQTPPMTTMICGCTVTTSGSGWCGPEGGFVDESTPVEWVCGSPGDPNDELNTECVVLPTGAARWCCAEDFSPACADE